MADFKKAFKRTLGHEGGFSDHPNDKGGITWKGIARNYHKDWPGWTIVDKYISQKLSIKMLNKVLSEDTSLEEMVGSFYKKGFWDINQLDKIENQLLAENIFDASVNCGVKMGPIFLQKAINKLYSINLIVDGILGNKTFEAIAKVLQQFGEEKLVNTYVDIREEYHKKIVVNNPSQKVFLKGWISRCENMRKKVG